MPTTGHVVRNATVHIMPQTVSVSNNSGDERQQNALLNAFAAGAEFYCLMNQRIILMLSLATICLIKCVSGMAD